MMLVQFGFQGQVKVIEMKQQDFVVGDDGWSLYVGDCVCQSMVGGTSDATFLMLFSLSLSIATLYEDLSH